MSWPSFDDRRALGIGKDVARNLARQGATVVLHGRHQARGEAVAKEIPCGRAGDRRLISKIVWFLGEGPPTKQEYTDIGDSVSRPRGNESISSTRSSAWENAVPIVLVGGRRSRSNSENLRSFRCHQRAARHLSRGVLEPLSTRRCGVPPTVPHSHSGPARLGHRAPAMRNAPRPRAGQR